MPTPIIAVEEHVATDTPYENSTDALAFLRDASLTDAQRSSISHSTAQRVFRL